MQKKGTFIICLNLPTRASRNFKSVLTIYPWGEWKLCVCICWFTNTPLALMNQRTCRPCYTDSSAYVQGLFSINLHFSIYFRHSIFLDSCLFKFSCRFFLPDIDECKSDSHVCHVNANCINTLGSYNCTCRPGYTGNGTNCTGIIKVAYYSFRMKTIDSLNRNIFSNWRSLLNC